MLIMAMGVMTVRDRIVLCWNWLGAGQGTCGSRPLLLVGKFEKIRGEYWQQVASYGTEAVADDF